MWLLQQAVTCNLWFQKQCQWHSDFSAQEHQLLQYCREHFGGYSPIPVNYNIIDDKHIDNDDDDDDNDEGDNCDDDDDNDDEDCASACFIKIH